VRDEQLGKPLKCACGQPIATAASSARSADPAWEDEIARLFDPAPVPPPMVAGGSAPETQTLEPASPPARVADGLKRAEPIDPRPLPHTATGPTTRPRAEPQPKPEPPPKPERTTEPSLRYEPEWVKKPESVPPTARGVRSLLPPPLADWKPDPRDPWPNRMAIVAVLYGGVWLSIEVLEFIRTSGSDLFWAPGRMMLNAAMVYGGIAIVKKDPLGAAWVGLSCLLYSFLPAFGLLFEINAFLAGDPMGEFFQALGLWLVRYGISTVLAVWGLRREVKRIEEEERRKEPEDL
jgi:hypothetical protein